MSALHTSTGNKVVDSGHEFEKLVEQVRQKLSRMVDYPRPRTIIDLHDRRVDAVCAPLTKNYVMTTHGLASTKRIWFFWKSKPHEMGRQHILTIDPSEREELIQQLQEMLHKEMKIYGEPQA